MLFMTKMNNINLIKEITDMRAALKKLEAEKMTELWKQFPPGVVINIYKELCKTIPELKGIPVELLLDRTVHPFQNKQLILKKLSVTVKDKERFEKITTALGETWTKLFPLWKQIDVKYMNQIPRLESRLLELDYNNPELDKIIQLYDTIVNSSRSVYDVEKKIGEVDNSSTRESLMELFRNTRNIIQVAVELN
jgi:mevalonate kinase